MPTTITSAGVTFNDTTTLTSANGVPSALKLTTARTINGVSFDGTANITVPATASGTNVAKAWVNFNGANGAIRSSYNISSIAVLGSAQYRLNFSTAMTDANYSVSTIGNWQTGVTQQCLFFLNNTLTTSCRIDGSGDGSPPIVCAQIFGN